MDVFGPLYDVDYLCQEDVQLASIPVLPSCVEDEADSFEALDPLLVLLGLAAEVAAVEGYFLEVVHVGLEVLVEGHHPVHNVGPVPEGVGSADEEVVLVEDVQQLRLQLADEEHSRLLEQVMDHLGSTLCEYQVGCTFVFNEVQENLYPLASPANHPIVFLREVRILQQLQPKPLQDLKAV